MKQFHCKYCARPMAVNFLEYRSNSYCNVCFDERVASKPIEKSMLNTFEFMGDIFPLSDKCEVVTFSSINDVVKFH